MLDTGLLRKARGAFFTPPALAEFIVDWAIRSGTDRVLEPSCGEAAFLVPAARALDEFSASRPRADQLCGVDIHAASTLEARNLLSGVGASSLIEIGDFFDKAACRSFDAVVGNPPFVRYQDFNGEARAKSLRAALSQGVRLSGLASSWAAFTVHAAQFLKPGGRLGLVLPAELLSVGYAAQVRRFLLDRFSTVRIVLFEERVFPEVLEDVVVLLAEGHGRSTNFEVYQARNLTDLSAIDVHAWTEFSPQGGDKWTSALVHPPAMELFERSLTADGFSHLSAWGRTYLGSVTGNNGYFTLTAAEAALCRLRRDELQPISPPGARHLRGLTFTQSAWESLRDAGKRCWLFSPAPRPSVPATRYIDAGEKAGVSSAYKCRVRTPWWQVPLVDVPDILFTYMNQDSARLVSNEAGVHALNSIYGIRLNQASRTLGRALLPLASLNSLTMLGAEIVGRAYGGGLLKHEPREADVLPVPSFALVSTIAEKLRAIAPQVSIALRNPDQSKAIDLVDQVILREQFGMSAADLEIVRTARKHLFDRRMARAKQVTTIET
jgi:adenine-specific DNA-methyltransferase